MNIENIKFRGKRKDNGEWVYGSYHRDLGASYIIHPIKAFVEAVPETITQYIGEKDINDEELYKGDIVELTFTDYYWQTHSKPPHAISPGERAVGEITYQNAMYVVRVSGGIFITFDEVNAEKIKVRKLGNKFDSVELLKAEEGLSKVKPINETDFAILPNCRNCKYSQPVLDSAKGGHWCSKREFLIEIYNRFICKDWTLDKSKAEVSIKQFLTLGEKQRIV